MRTRAPGRGERDLTLVAISCRLQCKHHAAHTVELSLVIETSLYNDNCQLGETVHKCSQEVPVGTSSLPSS
ncbi:hypothetical protein CROQUDRAFT_95621 [Cronartium quercuum f. sp. fusiforme G11]|uniref:Uncharacterized protein n=1 Tax=Cronartium quercuum f. sp. fusiforme G11 TaxID=708437 RepID=A0A9P6NE55_9BASI|nr:hypothetical protein CROQUDRAFT_95621 [Cronartium quercuum f. sp. fusiforme G11]